MKTFKIIYFWFLVFSALALITFFLLTSCAAKKVTTNNSTEKSAQANNTKEVNTNQSKAVVTVVGQSDDQTETVTKTTQYDTTKPDNPIQSETVTTIKKVGNKTEITKTEIAKDEKKASSDNSKIQTATTEDIKVVEIPKTPAVKYWLELIYILIIGAVVFLIYRNFQKIKVFFDL